MDYSKEIKDTVESFLKSDDWKYDFDCEYGVFETGALIKNALEYSAIYIFIREHNYTVYMDFGVTIPQDRIYDTIHWLTEINCGMILGSFEMEIKKGTLRYKYPVDCEGTLPGFDIIRNSLYTGIMMLTEHGDEILSFTTPQV